MHHQVLAAKASKGGKETTFAAVHNMDGAQRCFKDFFKLLKTHPKYWRAK